MVTCRRLALACAVLALAGCEPSGGGFSFLSGPAGPVVTRAELLDGAVVVAAPSGYCIDRNATRADTGFAVEASCALLARGGGGRRLVVVLLRRRSRRRRRVGRRVGHLLARLRRRVDLLDKVRRYSRELHIAFLTQPAHVNVQRLLLVLLP